MNKNISLKNYLLENIVLPSSDFLLGQSISKNLKFLMESQWWTRDQIDEHQNYNLRKLIKHAYENVPYYSDLFKKLKLTPADIKTKSDLYKIPILTKEEIRKNFPDKIVSRNLPKSKIIINSSSGSTGQPLRYFTTKKFDSLNHSADIRSWYWMNFRLGDKYVKISMHPRDSIIKKTQDLVNNSIFLFAGQLTEKNLLEIKEKIEAYNPIIIRSYPNILYYLSQVIEKNGGIKLNNLKAISTTGNTLHPFMREKIQEIFKSNIYDSYSCEGGSIYAQCESLNNYHLAEEYSISEFLEDDYSDYDHEGAKRHITTDLFNYATPFIRYDTQDYIVLGDNKKCSCGRNFLNISKIKGRDGDILILPKGKYLITENFFHYFCLSRPIGQGSNSYLVEDIIEQFQVYQEKVDLIRMRLVVNNLFNKNIKEEVYNYWKNYFGNDIELILEIVDKIEPTPNGKRRFVIRNPEIKIL